MDEYIEVKIDVFEHIGQRASVRRALTIRALVEEVLKEFNDIAADAPEKYAIYQKGKNQPLTADATLVDLDIQQHDELVFDSIYQDTRQRLEPHQYAALQDEAGTLYKIEWQPAIIGRPNNETKHDMSLAVNLQSHPKKLTISRSHAQITFSSGHYYIEPLSEHNPLLVEGQKVPFNTRQEIYNGNKIIIGAKGLQMTFRTQTPKVTVQDEPTAENVPLAILVIENANDEGKVGQKIELKQYPSMIGRKIPLLESERDVSRQHAEISYNPSSQKFFIKDLISANGVFINGVRLKPNQDYEIQLGMSIHLGPKLVLRFER